MDIGTPLRTVIVRPASIPVPNREYREVPEQHPEYFPETVQPGIEVPQSVPAKGE